MAGPDFTDLGVTDPTTGKPVYLTPQNMATVLGATGGVAPTQFQAGVEGAFKGIQAGQNIVSNFQEQAINSQVIDANEIKNNIARQTQDARILAENNRIKQTAIQTQMQTESLTSENSVLTAIHSGDANQLITAISDPKLITAAIKYNSEIEAVAAGLQGSFTPDQLQKLQVFRTTNSIHKNGDLTTRYNDAGKAVMGIPEVQNLQRQSGIPMDQLLAQMTVEQAAPGFDPVTGKPAIFTGGTVLVSPTGHKVMLPEKDNDTSNKFLPPFFSARGALANPGPLKLPQSFGAAPAPQQQSAPATEAGPAAAITEKSIPPVNAEGKTYSETLFTDPSKTVTPTSQPQAAAPVNPNAVSPLGVPLQTNISQLAKQNTALTVAGDTVWSSTMRKTQQGVAAGIPLDKAFTEASQQALAEAKVSDKTLELQAKQDPLARKKSDMATEIRQLVIRSQKAGLDLGPFWTQDVVRANQKNELAFDALTTEGGQAKQQALGTIYNDFLSLQSRYKSVVIATSGESKRSGDSDAELKVMLNQSPNYTMTSDALLTIADRLDNEAFAIKNEPTLARFFEVNGVSQEKATQYIDEFYRQNKASTFDEATGTFIPNTVRKDPMEFAHEKIGVSLIDAAKQAVTTPTVVPKATQQTPAAAGSGTSQPFAPAQKTPASGFPAPPLAKDVRGGNYDTTPASQKDIHAIADTAAAGGNIRQFQTGSSVPRKLDKATPDLMARLVGAESSGNIHAVSPIKRDANGKIVSGGVEGLAQVTKPTFKEVAPDVQKDFGIQLVDRRDPRQSLAAGTAYMNKMLDKYKGNVDFALAGYNAGPEKVDAAIEQAGTSNARGTIDQIAPYLPKTQPTEKYVKRITSRGRVSEQSEQAQPGQKNPGFFDTFSIDQLNPFGASTVEAEEPTKSPSGDPRDYPSFDWEAHPEVSLDKPQKTVESIPTPEEETPPLTPEEQTQLQQGISKGLNNPMKFDESQVPTTGTKVAVPKMETAPRNDVPPVSEIQAAINKEMKLSSAPFETTGRAVDFIRNSALGRWIGDNITSSSAFGGAEVFANAATLGLYDEGMGVLNDVMGLDGETSKKEVRASINDFRKNYPKTGVALDLIGTVAVGSGALKVLRAMKGPAIAGDVASSITPPTAMQGAAIQGGLGAARGFGEGTDAYSRTMGTVVGGGLGAATGALVSPAAAIAVPAVLGGTAAGIYEANQPKATGYDIAEATGIGAGVGALAGKGMIKAGGAGISAPMSLGLGVGALEGSIESGGNPMKTGVRALQGGGIGVALGILTHNSAAIQQALTKTVVRLNNYKGLQTLGNMLTKVFSGKTAGEIASDLAPEDALLASQFSYLKQKEFFALVKELGSLQGNHPEIPTQVIDVAQKVAPQLKTWTKVIQQIMGLPQTKAKIAQAMQDRMAGMKEGISENLGGPLSNAETTGNRIMALLKGTATTPSLRQANTDEAALATSGLYSAIEKQTPFFSSAKVKELLTVPEIQKAVALAREDIQGPLSRKEHLKALADQFTARVKMGMPIDDLMKPWPMDLPDNSFAVLKLATTKLGILAKETSNPKLKSDLFDKLRNLKEAMYAESPGRALEKADAQYAAIKSKVDFLKDNQIKAIEALANGDVTKAIPKIIAMSPQDLQSTVGLFGDLKDVAYSFVKNKVDTSVAQGNIASKLWTPKQWKNIETLLGKDRADELKTVADTYSRIGKTNSQMGGSDTIPKAAAIDEINQQGADSQQLHRVAASAVSGSVVGTIRNAAATVLNAFRPKADPAMLDSFAENIAVNASKGMKAMIKVLKAKGLQEKEIAAMEPYLKDWQAMFKSGGVAPQAEFTGKVLSKREADKQKRK